MRLSVAKCSQERFKPHLSLLDEALFARFGEEKFGKTAYFFQVIFAGERASACFRGGNGWNASGPRVWATSYGTLVYELASLHMVTLAAN